jgi:protein-disulfide isomerase
MKGFALISGVLVIAACAFAAESSGNTGSAGVVVVEINGAKITLGDFEQKHPMALFQARNTFYETQRKAVVSFVDEYLLEEQAKKEGLTVEQLWDKHVNSQIAKTPSDEALHVYYEGVDTKETFEAVRDRIIESIRDRRTSVAKDAFMQSLRDKAKVSYHVAPPRVQMSMKDTPVRGAANAPVTMVEFADYECPYCQQIQPTLDKLEAEFKGKIAFAYKDMPLPMHPDAPKAAEAAHCAEAQGKYWEFHDLLAHNKQLAMPALKENARTLKLDTAAFDKCLDSGEKAAIIKEHQSEAQALGVQGTPTFVINGRFINGTPDYDGLRKILEEEIGEATTVAQTSKR